MRGGPLSRPPAAKALSIWSEASGSLCDHSYLPTGKRAEPANRYNFLRRWIAHAYHYSENELEVERYGK
jgi:hypothetical protein